MKPTTNNANLREKGNKTTRATRTKISATSAHKTLYPSPSHYNQTYGMQTLATQQTLAAYNRCTQPSHSKPLPHITLTQHTTAQQILPAHNHCSKSMESAKSLHPRPSFFFQLLYSVLDHSFLEYAYLYI